LGGIVRIALIARSERPMKRESLLMLIAGVVLGAVLGFIATRQYYVDKMQKTPPPVAPPAQGAQAMPGAEAPQGQGAPAFDPNQHQAMLAQIKADLEKDPKNVEKRVMLGNIYYDGGKFEEAIPYYEEALKLDPKDSDVIVDLGICYRNTKKYDLALVKFDEALKLVPGKKQALFNQVIVYAFDKGDKAKGREILKTLKVQYPDDAMVKQLEQELGQ
jgi:cytochrome c-type biogenesis protein CcmH/NrfG